MKGQLHIIAGTDRGRRLFSPVGDRIRPTPAVIRESVFNILQDFIEGADFLDLYSGTGVMGCEALSRGAKVVTFVDNSRDAIDLIKRNIAKMSRPQACMVVHSAVSLWCETRARLGKKYDVIFIDPPYDSSGVPLRQVEPFLAPNGVIIFQRPIRDAVGFPFEGTNLEEYDIRRYGKTEISLWGFPEEAVETTESTLEIL